MELLDENNEVVGIAKKCKRPTFSQHRGRTWDSTDKIVDGLVIEWWFDSSWGRNMYFEYNEQWYSTPVLREDGTDSLRYKEKLFLKRSK